MVIQSGSVDTAVRWPQAGNLETRLTAEIKIAHVSAQMHSYFWSDECDQIVHNRTEYYFSRALSRNQRAAKITAAGATKEHAAGQLALHPADFPVRIRMPPGQCELFLCVFEPAFFDELTGLRGSWDSDETGVYYNIRNNFLNAAMARVQHEVENPGFASELLLESASTLLLVDLSSHVREARGIRRRAQTPGQLAAAYVKRIADRVAASEAMGCPTLEELANLCGISRHHMMRQFKVSTGETVHTFVERKRLTLAKQLLAENKLCTKEIAFRLGFGSPAYFSAAFRRLTSMTPTEFRRRGGRN